MTGFSKLLCVAFSTRTDVLGVFSFGFFLILLHFVLRDNGRQKKKIKKKKKML